MVCMEMQKQQTVSVEIQWEFSHGTVKCYCHLAVSYEKVYEIR